MNEQQNFKAQTDTNPIVQIVNRFLPYWPLFVISVALCLMIAYIKIRAEEPLYVAYGKIMLKDPEQGSDSKVLDALNMQGEKKSVENELLVMRSAGLLQEVVRRQKINVKIYNEGRVRLEELYKENSPVAFIPTRRDSIYSGGKYYFKMDWVRSEVEIDNKRVPFNKEVIIANTPYRVVPNTLYNKQVVGKNYFAIFNSVEDAAGELIGAIGANPMSSSSTVIDVKITTAVPSKGVDVLNSLFEVYNEYGIIEKNRTATKTLAFIEDRLTKVALQLDSVEQNVVDYRTTEAPYDLNAAASYNFSQANEMELQKNQIDLQITLLSSIKREIESGGTVPSTAGVSDGGLSSLIGGLQLATNDLKDLEATNGPKSDAVVNARTKVEGLRRDVLEMIENVRGSLSSTRGSYSSQMGRSTAQLKRNPQKEKAFAAISRQQGVKSTIYNYLLEKREETQLNSASTIDDLRVLETANAFGPVSPVPKTFYTKWFIIGLIVPGAFVLIKEQLNRKVQMRSDIEQKTAVPIVAEIAQINSDSPIVIREGKRTAVAEQFRSLRTNLTFMGLTEKTNTILLTSSVSGEGKSFTAINLAISFTLIGKKVALLELDLRKPKVSKLLQLKNDIGITNYLVNQATITEIIKPTEIKDLFVLPSGIIPPNPAELLQRERFRQMMAEVKERFDYIIIDTAPVGPVSDAFLLKDFADATVYLVRQNKTQRISLKMIEDLRQKNRFNNLCIAFNGLKKRGFTYGSYGYGSTGEGYYVSEEKEGRIQLFGKRIKQTLGMKS